MPFRIICKRLGADLLYTEFVNSEGLVRRSAKTHRKMLFLEEERPIGIQIYGGEDASMEGAARLAEELNPDFIDINCGCWVKNIAMRGAGAGLLKDPPRMERLVRRVIGATSKPVTVKTRLGWDAESIRIVEIAKMLEGTGAAALTIHCRTRSQGHSGSPDYTWIPRVKEAVSMPIIVNGGITSPETAAEVLAATGCDGLMIARGAIDNPWIFQQVHEYLRTGSYQKTIPVEERTRLCIEHLRLSVACKGDRTGILEMRKHYAGYYRGIPNSVHLRMSLMPLTEIDPIIDTLEQFRERVSGVEPAVAATTASSA